jgi:hypothetical protein
MKRVLAFFLIAAMALPSLNAQFTKVGGGLAFTSGYYFHGMKYDYNKSGNIALNLKGIYKINVPVQIAPSFTFLYPHTLKNINENTTVTTTMFDIDGHYVFNSLDKFEFYGIAGLDILLAWKRTKYLGTAPATYKESDNAFGLNVGAGSYMKLTDQFDLYFELKYLLSKRSQFMANAGILINIDWLKKHENTGIN